MNQASHYLDGSMLYGNSMQRCMGLRAMKGGRFASSEKFEEDFLPLDDAPEVNCLTKANNSLCFRSGDSRVNQHPQQAAMYTIWMREHNRIADALQMLNPHWDDKRIFVEARRIVIAEIQHITYSSWLPVVLGDTKNRALQVKNKGFSSGFDENTDPSVSNEVATAGFSFINSLLQKEIRIYDTSRRQQGDVQLQDNFYDPAITQEPGMLDALVRGLTVQNTQKMDASVVDDVTSKLYKGKNPFGFDVVSLDIQRGRDHGLPGYLAYRKMCRLPTGSKFESLLDSIPKASMLKLKTAYADPADIDLVTGILLETPVEGALVGPTLQCLLSEQFTRTRVGDRFFYDLPGFAHSFNEGQINEVKKSSLARVLCDNAVSVSAMQLDVFRSPSSKNLLVDCTDSRIPRMQLSAWKEGK